MDYSEEYRELISVLEYIVARHCSTGGYNNDENYRYPVNFTSRGHHGKYDEKFRFVIPPDAATSLYYEFGNHTVEIGKALEKIIDYIKENYKYTADIPNM